MESTIIFTIIYYPDIRYFLFEIPIVIYVTYYIYFLLL